MKAVRSKITAIITAVALLVGSVTATSVINKTSALQWDFEKAGFKNSWEYLLDRDGFVYGCDYCYVGMVDFVDHSLGPNFISNKSATYNHYMAYIDIYNIKALGFNAVNYWLLTNMQGIHFDENGYCDAGLITIRIPQRALRSHYTFRSLGDFPCVSSLAGENVSCCCEI